jgi:phenylacetic acid degradation operon negative regulatory protein
MQPSVCLGYCRHCALANCANSQQNTAMAGQNLIEQLLSGLDLKSTGFIITIYGDVVVPRGGTLWTGSLIDLCGAVGLSESVVRTALSRLAGSEQLQGLRLGRRSYYQLHPSAQAEFKQAAQLLYAPIAPATGWQIIHHPEASDDDLRQLKATRLSPQVLLRPDRGQRAPSGFMTFSAGQPTEQDRILGLWDLVDLRLRYQSIIERFEPLAGIMAGKPDISPSDALLIRLLLVNSYRAALLRDPHLPEDILPLDWPGKAARQLFNALYLALSPLAESHIAKNLEGQDGPLSTQTQQSDATLTSIQQF